MVRFLLTMNLEFTDQRPESGWIGGRPSYRNVIKTGLALRMHRGPSIRSCFFVCRSYSSLHPESKNTDIINNEPVYFDLTIFIFYIHTSFWIRIPCKNMGPLFDGRSELNRQAQSAFNFMALPLTVTVLVPIRNMPSFSIL